MPEGEAKAQLERLGLPDVLGSLCPGALLLASTVMWLPINSLDLVGRLAEVGESVPVSFLLLLVSYALGLVLNAWAAQGFVEFVELPSLVKGSRGIRRALAIVRFPLVALLHGRRFKVGDRTSVEARFAIYELIRTRYGEGVVRFLNPNSFLYVFRVLIWCQVKDKEETALNEADALFRRRGFAQGVALAGMLVGLEAATELTVIWLWRLPHPTPLLSALIGIVASGVAASLLLRNVAWRLYADEQIFTYAILRSANQQSAQPAIK